MILESQELQPSLEDGRQEQLNDKNADGMYDNAANDTPRTSSILHKVQRQPQPKQQNINKQESSIIIAHHRLNQAILPANNCCTTQTTQTIDTNSDHTTTTTTTTHINHHHYQQQHQQQQQQQQQSSINSAWIMRFRGGDSETTQDETVLDTKDAHHDTDQDVHNANDNGQDSIQIMPFQNDDETKDALHNTHDNDDALDDKYNYDQQQSIVDTDTTTDQEDNTIQHVLPTNTLIQPTSLALSTSDVQDNAYDATDHNYEVRAQTRVELDTDTETDTHTHTHTDTYLQHNTAKPTTTEKMESSSEHGIPIVNTTTPTTTTTTTTTVEVEVEVEVEETEVELETMTQSSAEQAKLHQSDNDDDDDNNTSNNNASRWQKQQGINSLRENAFRLRTEGKELHDEGDFTLAARTFWQAAQELEKAITAYTVVTSEGGGEHCDDDDEEEGEIADVYNPQLLSELAEECATCLLHQALCDLKDKNYVECIQSCTDVLKDGVQIIPLLHTQQQHQGKEEDTDDEEVVKGNDNGTDDDTRVGDNHNLRAGDETNEKEREGDNANNDDKEEDGAGSTVDTRTKPQSTPTVIRISPSDGANTIVRQRTTSSSSDDDSDETTRLTTTPAPTQLSAAVRARAFHRRAKARLALGDSVGALDDSRSAAFLGDRNAVALYGRLMREQPTGGSAHDSNDDGGGGNTIGDLFSSSSALDSLFSGGTPSLGTNGSNNSNSNSNSQQDIIRGKQSSSSSSSAPSAFDILNSFMGSAGGPNNGNNDLTAPAINPLSAFGDIGNLLNMGNTKGNAAGGGGGAFESMAKSVLVSLTNRIEDESTQRTISKYLRGLDVTQLMSLSSMAGIPINQSSAEKLVSIANGFTPSRIRKGVKLTKRMIMVVNLIRKVLKVISKYKHLLILFVLISWIKSAILQPVVVGKGAVKKAAKKAIRDSIATASFLF